MQLRELISFTAAFSTVGLYCTGIPVCLKIVQNGTTNETSFFPLMVMFISSVLWIKYGLLQTSSAFVYVNSLGVILSLSYIVIYYCYTFQRKNLHHQFLVGASLLLPPLIHVKYFAQNHDDAVLYLSYTCAAVNILFYGSPLFAIAEVLTTRSTACMAFPISLGSFLLSLQWYIYGCLLKDLFVQIPNGLGFLLGIVQLVLFWKFPQRKASRSAYR